jgi:hypothetical protein
MPQHDRWSDEKREGAQKMRDSGVTWEDIGAAYGCSAGKVKYELIPGYRASALRNQRHYRIKKRLGKLRVCLESPPYESPVEKKNPIYDPKRDGVPEHQSFTAEFLGDPFPGRAELMRRAG